MAERQFVNYYRCPEDGEEWADVWSCCCNDRCPKCGIKDIEPYKSAEVVHTRDRKSAYPRAPRCVVAQHAQGPRWGYIEDAALKGRRYTASQRCLTRDRFRFRFL